MAPVRDGMGRGGTPPRGLADTATVVARRGVSATSRSELPPWLMARAAGCARGVARSAAGLVIDPVDYQPGRRYPTVAFIHGGPAGVWTAGFPETTYRGWEFGRFMAGLDFRLASARRYDELDG